MGNQKVEKQKIRRKSKWRIYVIIFLIAVTSIFGLSHYWPDSGSVNSNVELYQVKRGDMRVSVVENGSIAPVKSDNKRSCS